VYHIVRIAIVSDIHGNLIALEAVLVDLRDAAPDLILHGGDLPIGGSAPAEVIDRIRDLGWPGVLGNTDEILFDPGSAPNLGALSAPIQEIAAWNRDAVGMERINWLRSLPRVLQRDGIAVVHATPESTWRSPGPESTDAELRDVYAALAPLAIFGHVHRSFVRVMDGLTVANSGSVSLSYDGDPRASYLLVDDGVAAVRRVAYDLQREIRGVLGSGQPHAAWTVRMLETAGPALPG